MWTIEFLLSALNHGVKVKLLDLLFVQLVI